MEINIRTMNNNNDKNKIKNKKKIIKTDMKSN
jgi:hypothetical protein